jgi:hypothetical protein
MATLSHLMLDLETIDNSYTSAILSIAAVPWNPDTGAFAKKNYFYEVINLQSCFDKGLTAGGDTIEWWFHQSENARMEAIGKNKDKLTLPQALIKFELFLNTYKTLDNKGYKIWGNSARFDIGILANAYKVCNLPIPWSFRNERDVRTLVQIIPDLKTKTKFTGVRHNPVDDCKHQIKYCSKIWRKINGKQTQQKTTSKKAS